MTQDKSALPPEFFQARFWCVPPPQGLPARFGVVTAFNPGAKSAPLEKNQAADRALEDELAKAGLPRFRVTGGAPDKSHMEPGWGIEAPLEAIRSYCKKYAQAGFYWVEDGKVAVAAPDGPLYPVGLWKDLLAA